MTLGSENLALTYLTLGLSMPGSEPVESQAYLACLGEFEHAICNFATRLDLDPWSVKQLHDLAVARPSFNVYSLPGDRPAHRHELLERQGFRLSYRLIQMVALPQDPGPAVELRTVTDISERVKVAEFMSQQFFTRTPLAIRTQLAKSTAQAMGLDLCDLLDNGQRIGALMLCRQPNAMGVYNVCVAAGRRGKGIGRSVVAWSRAEAFLSGVPLCLQCDARLVKWYESLGFVQVGSVDVFSLPKDQPADIMK